MALIVLETIITDVLVIGAGGAGLMAAIEAAEQGVKVLVTTKGPFGRDGSATWMAGWGFGAAIDPMDSPEQHLQDTLRVGQYLNNQEVTREVINSIPQVYKSFRRWGVRYLKKDQKVVFTTLPGHSRARIPRIARSAGMGGYEYRRVLPRQVRKMPSIRIIDDFMVLSLLTAPGGDVAGAIGLNLKSGEFQVINAKCTILATGGFMGIYKFSSTSPSLIGDGLVMAFQAGARLVDMEFTDFYTTCVTWPPIFRGDLDWIANLRYDLGGVMYNKRGQDFLGRSKNLAISIPVKIQREIEENRGSPHGGVYLSFKHLPENMIDDWFDMAGPLKWVRRIRDKEIDIKRNGVEVAPAPLESLGGCQVNKRMETTVPGLYAAGEVAGGCEGAYTLAGNPVAFCFTMGMLAGRSAGEAAKVRPLLDLPEVQILEVLERSLGVLKKSFGVSPFAIKEAVQDVLEKNGHLLGRTENGLKEGIAKIRELRSKLPEVALNYKGRIFNLEWAEYLQLPNILTVVEIFLTAAMNRRESRGLHFREDYPQPSEGRLFNVLIQKGEGNGIVVETRDLDTSGLRRTM